MCSSAFGRALGRTSGVESMFSIMPTHITNQPSRIKPGKENPKTLDDQREACLISLLRDKREHFLWGFPYYFAARQFLAVVIGLIQFVFAIVLLILKSIWEGLKYIADLLSKQSHRNNPTEGTYIADRENFIHEDECKGPPVNRWTNTHTPATVNKQCQVTNANVKAEYTSGGTGGVGFKSSGTGTQDAAESPALQAGGSPSRSPRTPGRQLDELPQAPGLSNVLNKARPLPGSLFGNNFLSAKGVKQTDSDSELSVVEFEDGRGEEVGIDNMFIAADAMMQSELVYFGDGDQVNFVLSDAFQTVLDFRKGIKTFYRFLGPLSQVKLELDHQELHDSDPWPVETSKLLHVHITLHTMYAQREKKKVIQARSELRGMTDLENRLASHMI